jgi:hypothetical protein
MAERHLTFKQYLAEGEDRRPPVDFWWRGLPWRPVGPEAKELLASAGLAGVPLVELASGYLEAPWQGHPQNALVITTSVGFRPGERYAVSTEPGPVRR